MIYHYRSEAVVYRLGAVLWPINIAVRPLCIGWGQYHDQSISQWGHRVYSGGSIITNQYRCEAVVCLFYYVMTSLMHIFIKIMWKRYVATCEQVEAAFNNCPVQFRNELQLGRRNFLFRACCTSFHIHSSLLTFFLCVFLIFHFTYSYAKVLGTTLVHEVHISYSHAESYVLFSRGEIVLV